MNAGLARLAARLREHASQSVTYVRGAQSVSGVPAVIGKTEFEGVDERNVVTSYVSRDFLVRPADLAFDGDEVIPQRGDRILETDGSVVRIHEVLAPGKEPVWRWSDPHRQLRRIHTKEIGVA